MTAPRPLRAWAERLGDEARVERDACAAGFAPSPELVLSFTYEEVVTLAALLLAADACAEALAALLTDYRAQNATDLKSEPDAFVEYHRAMAALAALRKAGA